MRGILTGTAILLLAQSAIGSAQSEGKAIRVGLSVGATSFGGAATPLEARDDHLEAMPFRPTMWGLSASYGAAGLRLGVAAAYGEPGLALRGHPATGPGQAGEALLLVADNAFRLVSLSATLSIRIKRFPAGTSLRPSLGLLLERWSTPGAVAQTILGGQTGLTVEVPITRSLAGTLTGEVGYTPESPFHDSVVPEGFKPRDTWRRTLAGGVAFRL